MLTHLRPALVLFILLSLITGVVYPLAITGIAQVAFEGKANGSLIAATGYPHAPRGSDADSATSHAERGGTRYLGSSLIGQEFGTSDPAAAAQHAKWFWGRPSATGPVPYTALNLDTGTGSSGSNLAPTNPALLDNIKARLAALDAADASVGIARTPTAPASSSTAPAPRTTPVPIDLVTASASGLDPHISPAAAEYQVPRIAKARSMTEDAVRALVAKHTTGRTLGLLGEPVVNVRTLNHALE
jgi:K+-transporting ATPase ATPase C chain